MHAPLPQDPEAPLRAALARQRAIATLLLLVMAGLMVGSYALPPGYWTDLLQAAAKAGVVGGIADWFAVTALFRRPLGLPIPHTAIIPAQKERLGQGLGRFVANHVFTEAEVRRVMGRLDLSSILRGFLADPAAARPAAQAIAASLPKVLASLEDGRARRLMGRLLPRLAGGAGGAALAARVLRQLLEDGRYNEVFDLVIAQLRTLMAQQEDRLRDAIAARVRSEGGALVGWIAGAGVARRVLAAVNAELAKIETSDSEMRYAFAAWLRMEMLRLETDPERIAQVGRALRSAAQHPTVAAWLGELWTRLRTAMETDAANPEGRTVALLEGAFANAGKLLAEDEAARARLNRVVEGVLISILPSARLQLADFIELRVGRDLQYVRMNGTLVGFLVGGVLFAVLTAIFGRVAV
jgi:uncharacterized membrane-anchored protein YjiN (DUF445 family)